jgi:Xaa-Pro aminopeptidase
MEIALLTTEEKIWLNNYHDTVLRRLSPMLNNEEQAWLANKCRHI